MQMTRSKVMGYSRGLRGTIIEVVLKTMSETEEEKCIGQMDLNTLGNG
jgi:hypothetical protein